MLRLLMFSLYYWVNHIMTKNTMENIFFSSVYLTFILTYESEKKNFIFTWFGGCACNKENL